MTESSLDFNNMRAELGDISDEFGNSIREPFSDEIVGSYPEEMAKNHSLKAVIADLASEPQNLELGGARRQEPEIAEAEPQQEPRHIEVEAASPVLEGTSNETTVGPGERSVESVEVQEEVVEESEIQERLDEVTKKIADLEEDLKIMTSRQYELNRLISEKASERDKARTEFRQAKDEDLILKLDEISLLEVELGDLRIELSSIDPKQDFAKIELSLLEGEQRALRSKLALSELSIETADFNGEVSELISRINSTDATPPEIISLLSHVALTEEELSYLKEFEVNGKLHFSARNERERAVLLAIAERLKGKVNEEFLIIHPELSTKEIDEKYVLAANKDTNLTALLQMAGTPEDVRAIEGLITKAALRIELSGEIVAEEGHEAEYEKIRKELFERIKAKYAEKLRGDAEKAIDQDPLIKAVEDKLDELREEKEKMEKRFPFSKGKLLKRFMVSLVNNENLGKYDETLEAYNKLDERIGTIREVLSDFRKDKLELVEDYIELKLNLSEFGSNFDPLNPDAKMLTSLLGTAEAVYPLENYESAEAEFLQKEVGEGFAKPEKKTMPKTKELRELVEEEEYEDILDKLKEQMRPIVEKAMARPLRGVADDETREKIMRVALNSQELKNLLDLYILEKGASRKLSEMGSSENQDAIDAESVHFLLNRIYQNEIEKGNKRIEFKKFVEELTLKYKLNQVTKGMEEGFKVSLGYALSAEGSDEELATSSVKDIVLAGHNLIALTLKTAGLAHQGVMASSYAISGGGAAMGEWTNGVMLALGGENSERFNKKIEWSTRKDSLKKKNEKHKGLWAEIFTAFWG